MAAHTGVSLRVTRVSGPCLDTVFQDGAVDPAAIERLRALQADIVGELIEVFLEQSPRQQQTLRAAAASGAHDLVRRTVHTLKGDAAAWGAYDLEQRCATIERLSPDDLTSSLDGLLTALEQELGRVSAALGEVSRMERHLV